MSTHTPALSTTLPTHLAGYEVKLAVPQRDRPGSYPAWTVLCYREDEDEYVVWTAYYRDDDKTWAAEGGDYFGRSWYGPDYARDALDRFWERARSAAWRPTVPTTTIEVLDESPSA